MVRRCAVAKVQITLNGQVLEVEEAVAKALAAQGAGKKGSAPSLESLVAKHPWIREAGATEVKQIPSGNGNFKFGVDVKCRAGFEIKTTSRYVGVDCKIPTRIDTGVSGLQTYDYTGLEKCEVPMTKATSDLHQSHLCPGCKTKLGGFARKNTAELVRAAQEAVKPAAAPAPEAPKGE